MISRWNYLCLGLLLVLLPSLLRAEDLPKKNPPPEPTALKDAIKQVNDTFKDDLAAAKTPPLRAAVAKKMIAAAAEKKDLLDQFALCTRAREIASEAGDYDTVLTAIDTLDKTFDLDALKMKADLAIPTAKGARTIDSRESFVNQLDGVITSAVAADRYDLGRSLSDTALLVARSTNNANLVRQVMTQMQQVRDTEKAYDEIKRSLQVLVANPADPEANLKVGKFRCFIKGEWEKGLPLLAQGNDPLLHNLAKQEIDGPKDAETQVKLGDGWWDAGEQETGTAKLPFQQRADKWYRAAVPNLTGPARARVEARLKTLAGILYGKVVDLIKLIDTKRDAVVGNWDIRNGTLVSDGKGWTRLEILYQPPAEYDYVVVFTRTGGNDAIMQTCWALGHQFNLGIGAWSNTLYGIETVGGKRIEGNPTTRQSKAWLVNGQRYTSIVKVRKDRVQAYLDGKLLVDLKTDFKDLSLVGDWKLHRTDTIGIVACSSSTVFHSVQIIEITGKGKLLKPSAP
ncbi:MAG: hypothetical protein WCI73_05965 [Phycisphaerae bacterium]